MIRLNRMTDYAVVVLSLLAFEGRRQNTAMMSASEIASRTGITQPATAKIMKLLAHAGFVEAARGKDGGYTLVRAPETLSIVEIIEAMEGPIALTACVEASVDPCASRHSCFIGGHWEKVNSAIADALECVTLADMIDPQQLFIPAEDDHLAGHPEGVM